MGVKELRRQLSNQCDGPQLLANPFLPFCLSTPNTVLPPPTHGSRDPLPPLLPFLLPSLAFLPGPFHEDLLSMMEPSDRVRMASVSPALRVLYGSTLDRLRLRSPEGRRLSALASLLQKQRNIQFLEAWPKALPELSVVMNQGCIARLQVMIMMLPVEEESTVDIDLIAHAMSLQGALQALERLSLVYLWQPGQGVLSLPTIRGVHSECFIVPRCVCRT